jgi:hypothetical protein
VASLRQVNAPRSAVAIDNVVLRLAAADHDGYEHRGAVLLPELPYKLLSIHVAADHCLAVQTGRARSVAVTKPGGRRVFQFFGDTLLDDLYLRCRQGKGIERSLKALVRRGATTQNEHSDNRGPWPHPSHPPNHPHHNDVVGLIFSCLTRVSSIRIPNRPSDGEGASQTKLPALLGEE